jgi:hypothetical protein
MSKGSQPLSPADGQTLASGGQDRTVRFWNLAGLVPVAKGQPAPPKDEFGPEVKGLRAKVHLVKQKVVAGEPVEARYMVKNVSKEEQTLWHSGFWPNHLILVHDAQGKEAALTAFGRQCRNAFSPGGERKKNVPVKVPAGGEDATEGSYDLTRLYDLSRPGRYTVQYIYEEKQGGWEGRLPSNVADFEVLPPQKKEGAGKAGPAGLDPSDPKVFARLNQAELVFTGKVTKVDRGAVGYTDPPLFSDDLRFRPEAVLRGPRPDNLTFIRNISQPEEPHHPMDVTYLVTADHVGDHWVIGLIGPAEENIVAMARQAVALPLGWSLEAGRAVSPGAALGENAWPRGAVAESGPVCSRSSRPALRAGDGIELTAEQVLPAQTHPFRNPFGDGRFRITVTNRGTGPATVGALLTDGKAVLWEDSLLVMIGSTTYLLPGAGKARAVRPAVLKPGESVSTVIDTLPLKGVDWPRGGWRVYFRFCLGEKSALNFFYYRSDHHDPLRDAALRQTAR